MNSDELLKKTANFEIQCTSLELMVKLAFIRKLPNGKYRVVSRKGKNLGTYNSRAGAEKRLKAVEYFKHLDKGHAEDGSSKVIDLTDIDEFSYSAMMRKLREKASKEQVQQFLSIYKKQFDMALKKGTQKPEKVALQNAVIKFHKLHPIKLDHKMIKLASVVSELGNADQVGKYLSTIIKFIATRVPSDKKNRVMEVLRNKFQHMNESEISSKDLPVSAIYGQAITFVKHVLFNHDASYVRLVLNSLAQNL